MVNSVVNFPERCIETPWVASIIKKYGIRSILDIGFTMSSLDYLGMLLELKKFYSIEINAVDIVNPERVKNRYPKDWLNDILSIPIVIGDIRSAQLPKEEYDTVTCISTIEHIGFDQATIDNPDTAFERKLDSKDVTTERLADTDNIVLRVIHKTLKPKGKLLISVPMGKGGVSLLQDSLGYYCAAWEYEENSWSNLIRQQGYTVIEQHFFKMDEKRQWIEVKGPLDLKDKTIDLKEYAEGCALVLLEKM